MRARATAALAAWCACQAAGFSTCARPAASVLAVSKAYYLVLPRPFAVDGSVGGLYRDGQFRCIAASKPKPGVAEQ
jgi:hypothetical protein